MSLLAGEAGRGGVHAPPFAFCLCGHGVAVLRERVVGVAIFLTCGAGVVRVFLSYPVFVSLFVVGVCLLWLVFMWVFGARLLAVWFGVARRLVGAV